MEKRGTPDSGVEQAVSRTLRDNLAKLQTTADELNQAVADLVAACASSRPTNSLPPMLRAQTAAALTRVVSHPSSVFSARGGRGVKKSELSDFLNS